MSKDDPVSNATREKFCSVSGERSFFSETTRWHLCKRLLAVVFQVLRVDVEVIVVDGERLRTFGNAWHKLLHFKEDAGLLANVKLLHRNVG